MFKLFLMKRKYILFFLTKASYNLRTCVRWSIFNFEVWYEKKLTEMNKFHLDKEGLNSTRFYAACLDHSEPLAMEQIWGKVCHHVYIINIKLI